MILITGGPASISALFNNDVDLDMRAPVAALQAMAHGVKLTFLLSQSNTLEYDVVTRPEIKDIKQLKGKKVGIIRFGGISELMVRYLFQKLGLDADKDIAIIQVGQARFVAMEKGAIDATVFASAESAYAKRNGFRVLDMPTLPFFGSTIVTTPGIAAKRSDVMMRYMRGYLDGVRFFLNDREKSMQYLGDLLRTKDRDMIDLAYKNHPQHQMGRKPYPDMNAVKATLDIMSVARTGSEETQSGRAVHTYVSSNSSIRAATSINSTKQIIGKFADRLGLHVGLRRSRHSRMLLAAIQVNV